MSFKNLSVLLWTALCLLGVELLLEARAVHRGWEAPLLGRPAGWASAPDSGFGPTPEFPFRSAIVPPERRPGVQRVWIASSSYGADLQLPPDEVFPNLLGRVLSEAGHPTETLNASVDGYRVATNVADLRRLGPRWKPDVAVLYQMSNDIDFISSSLDAVESASVGAGQAADSGPNAIQRWIEATTVFKHLKTQITARVTKGRVLLDALPPQSEGRFESDLLEFVAAARAVGARPVLCTFATSHVRATLSDLPPAYEYNLLRFNVVLSVEGWLDAVERFNRVIERVAQEQDVPLVDLASELGGRAELFRDLWHLKRPGHELAARAIARVLDPELEQ